MPLDDVPSLQPVNHTTQLGVTKEPVETLLMYETCLCDTQVCSLGISRPLHGAAVSAKNTPWRREENECVNNSLESFIDLYLY